MQRISMNAIVVFVATAYSLSILLSLIVGFTGGHESALAGPAYLSSTFVPEAAVMIVAATMNEGPRIRWDNFPLRYLPVALFLIPGTLSGGFLLLLGIAIVLLWCGVPTDASSSADVTAIPTSR